MYIASFEPGFLSDLLHRKRPAVSNESIVYCWERFPNKQHLGNIYLMMYLPVMARKILMP